MLLPLLDPVLGPYLGQIDYDVRRVPHWLMPVVERYVQAYVGQRLAPKIAAARTAGAGVCSMWWTAETPGDTVLRWLDDGMARTPHVGSLDRFRVTIVACSEAERVAMSDGILQAAREQVGTVWIGGRKAWWTEGRERCEVAVLAPHEGMFTSLEGLGTMIHVALRPQR